ncbi:hypothetical protein FRC03_012849 [Tulasnella sp. 419]|nr:hypothetical protein FRC03_012849 [Tulasnella sp. 419]
MNYPTLRSVLFEPPPPPHTSRGVISRIDPTSIKKDSWRGSVNTFNEFFHTITIELVIPSAGKYKEYLVSLSRYLSHFFLVHPLAYFSHDIFICLSLSSYILSSQSSLQWLGMKTPPPPPHNQSALKLVLVHQTPPMMGHLRIRRWVDCLADSHLAGVSIPS